MSQFLSTVNKRMSRDKEVEILKFKSADFTEVEEKVKTVAERTNFNVARDFHKFTASRTKQEIGVENFQMDSL